MQHGERSQLISLRLVEAFDKDLFLGIPEAKTPGL